MATYKGREVRILDVVPTPEDYRVVIGYTKDNLGNETVQRSNLILTDAERKKLLEDDKKALDAKYKAMADKSKEEEKAAKQNKDNNK